jgi:hypothetical protein
VNVLGRCSLWPAAGGLLWTFQGCIAEPLTFGLKLVAINEWKATKHFLALLKT